MGYTLKIGNAVPTFSKDDGYLYAAWEVTNMSSTEAPVFPGDETTGNTNSRSPSYTGWHDFSHATGLAELFYDKYEGLLNQHPGCFMLTEEHGETVRQAVAQYPRTLPPGFDDGDTPGFSGKYDPHLARLLWLDYWVQWALKHCETPAFQNT
jgi:hypothetical protein